MATTGGTAVTPAPPPGEAQEAHGRQLLIIYLSLMLAMLLAALDQTIVSTALPTIVNDLHGLSHLSWVVTAYMLASTATTQVWGKLGDQYGRKYLFLGAIVIFLIGSVLCGQSRNMGELIAFRAVQGVGGGGLMSVTMVVMAQLAPPEERARKGGIGGIVAGLGLVAGPLVGGLLADHLGWRWIFFVNVPLGIAVLVVAATMLHLPSHHERRRIDYPGAMLAAGFAVTLSLLLEWGGDRYAWTSATSLGLGVLALALLAGFLVREATAAEPVLPLRLFANPTIRWALPLQGLVGIAMTGAIVYVMIYLQVARGVSAEHAGYFMIALAVGMTAAGMVVGRLVSRGVAITTFMITGTGLGALALGMLGLLRVDSGTVLMAGALLVYGLGLGQVIGVLVMVVQNAAPAHQLGVATTALRLFQTLGSALGAAAFGAVFSHAFAARVPGVGHGGVAALASVPAGEQHAALAGVVHGLDVVFLVAAVVMALATVLAVVLRAQRAPAAVEEAAEPELVAA